MSPRMAEIVKAYDLAIAKHDDGFLPITKQHYETPAPENLFTVNEDCEKLPKQMAADFHTVVAKMLYVTKGARPDTCLSVAAKIQLPSVAAIAAGPSQGSMTEFK